MKTCTICEKTLALTLFHRKSENKDGLRNQCKDCRKTQRHLAYLANKEAIAVQTSAYRSKNRPVYNTSSLKWRKNNPGKVNANRIKYYADKDQRTPKWLTTSQLNEIKELYVTASELSWLSLRGLHVDHIIPLRGKNVSGLHVPWNLQIIPAEINLKKTNKFEVLHV